MCSTCGCGPSEHHHHHSDHDHDHTHEDHGKIVLEEDILTRNNTIAERVKGYLAARNIFALNLMSSPGSGKTTLLEKTIQKLADQVYIYVIEGDQQTSNDADRIRTYGIPAIQINTGNGCHLESEMVYNAVTRLNPDNGSLLFIENVGNLVCPAIFALGENKKVVIISTTEGDDKPLKYPQMFYESDICVINKIDLLPYLNANIETLKENLLKVNPRLTIFEVSATTGEGVDEWCNWIMKSLAEIQPIAPQRSFFDERAAHWDITNHVNPDKINFLLEKLNITPEDHILDVGTGTGILIPYLEKRSPKGSILGVDISPEMILEARKKFAMKENVHFQIMDIETSHLGDKFDKIILFSVFPHIEKKSNTITRLMQHLTPGGKLMIAHDQSREFLNKLHTGKDDRLQTSLLLSAENQKRRFEEIGLHVSEAFENDQYYYLILENQG